MRIREDVLRYLTVRVEALNEEPSPMMQSKYRDEKPSKADDSEENAA